MQPEAKVIADSINLYGDRLTTLEVVMHRFVLAEFNTHRMFSRNSASSRAIPLAKQISKLKMSIAMPVSWPAEQKGMQGGDELLPQQVDEARHVWAEARDDVIYHATRLGQLGVHKSIANRLLEPFMWHTVIVSSTEWENFFRQRCSPLAQPEIREAAEAMRDAIKRSTPAELHPTQWHVPYINAEDYAWASQIEASDPAMDDPEQFWRMLCRVSAARCARVSYLTQSGVRDPGEDLAMYNRLVEADPPHASPLEHVARPTEDPENWPSAGNFRGWDQLRHLVLGF
jgi:thymidylate synthase ThyX